LIGWLFFGLQPMNQLYRGQVGAELFLWRACAKAISGGNPITILIED
jgi:hypothetical protein